MDTTSLPPDDRPPVEAPRRTNRGLLWAAALAVVVLAIATGVAFTAGGDDATEKLGGDPSVPGGLEGDTDVSGQALPSISYTTFDGEQVALAPGDKPLVVNFWAASCIPCVTEMPDLEQFHQANPDVDLLGLQALEAPEAGLAMIDTTGITYPVGRDPRGIALGALGGASLPRTVIVAPDGRITWAYSGQVSAEQLQTALDQTTSG
ncbi:MAG TPA: TlpA disulfide reductase family protein [Acidimicrobiales bacterium]